MWVPPPSEFQRSLSSSEPQAFYGSCKAFSPNSRPHSTLVVDPALLLKELNTIQSAVAGALYFRFLPCKKKKPRLDKHKRTCLSSWVGVRGGKRRWAQWNLRRNAKNISVKQLATLFITQGQVLYLSMKRGWSLTRFLVLLSICVCITQKSSFLEWRLSSKRCSRDNDYIYWKCSVQDD